MKALMAMSIDTVWGNKVTVSVETQLDNPHILTTQELSALMLHSLKMMAEEVRVENERTVGETEPTMRETLAEARGARGESERELERYREVEARRRGEDNL